MLKQPFILAIASICILIALAGCAPSPVAQDCSIRRTVIEGTIGSN